MRERLKQRRRDRTRCGATTEHKERGGGAHAEHLVRVRVRVRVRAGVGVRVGARVAGRVGSRARANTEARARIRSTSSAAHRIGPTPPSPPPRTSK